MITNQDIVCLSSQDWNDLWTRKQRFMQRFARQGNRVLYVETQASLVSVGVWRTDWRRAFRWLRGPRRVEESLYIATLPLLLPFFQMSLGINRLNNVVVSRLLRRWIRQLGFQSSILWTYNPHSESLVGRLGERLAVYECVDELTAAKGLLRRETVQVLERRLIEKVDLVVVTHENLYRSKRVGARDIHLVPNAADVEHFQRAALPDTPVSPEMQAFRHPIVGFLGTIQYWIDFDLLRFLALAKPEWSFVLIGPCGRLARVDKIKDRANVHMLGRKRYEDLPSYLKAFDVCLNPYVLDETALNCSPLKLYEYLATGKPVVSVDMPEAQKFDGLISIGRDYAEILHLLEASMRPEAASPHLVAARIGAVKNHSWGERFSQLEAVVEQHLGRRTRESGVKDVKDRVAEFWDATPCGTRGVKLEPGTQAYFDRIEAERYRLEPFIPEFADFPRWGGKRVLEVGVGAGTDFTRFVRGGVRPVGVDLSRRSLDLVKQRLRVYGLDAPLVHADAERLPFPSDTFDLVYSWGVLHHTPRMAEAIAEVRRVVKPGGAVRVMIYNRRSWLALFMYLRFGLLAGKPFRSWSDVIASHVESVGTRAVTRAEACRLFVAFSDVRIETVLTPYDRLEDTRFGRFFPGFLVNWLGRRFGWFMLIRATKPLTPEPGVSVLGGQRMPVGLRQKSVSAGKPEGEIRVAINALSGRVGAGVTGFSRLLPALSRLDSQDEFHIFVSRSQPVIHRAIPPNFHPHIVSFDPRNLVARVLFEQLVLPIMLLRWRIDVLYSVGNITSLLAPCKVVLMVGNANPYSHLKFEWSRSERVRNRLIRLLSTLSAWRADKIQFLSENSRDHLSCRLGIPANRTSVIYYGFAPVQVDSGSESGGMRGVPPRFILTVSTLAPHKNIERLMSAFSLLVERYRYSGALVIVGAPAFSEYAKRLEDLRLTLACKERILLLGEIADAALPAYFQAADAFVSVSLEETLGLPVIEAMGYGTPVVAGKCPQDGRVYFNPFVEVCGDAAAYCNPLEVESIAEALHSVVTDPGRREFLRQQGLLRARDFDWTVTARRLHQLFREAAQRS